MLWALIFCVAHIGVAANSSCIIHSGGHFTINNQSDVDALSGCNTLKGDVHIINANLDTLNLHSISAISGDLNISSCNSLTAISAPNLTSIEGGLILQKLPLLQTFDFPILKYGTNLILKDLPSISVAQLPLFTAECMQVVVSRTSAAILTLDLKFAQDLKITDNPNLNSIFLQQMNQAGSMIVSGNGNKASAHAYFDSLSTAGTIILSGIGYLSMAQIQTVVRDLMVEGNYFNSVTFPRLTNIGGTLAFIDNVNLYHFHMAALAGIGLQDLTGSLLIKGNPLLAVDDLGSLDLVASDITIEGFLSNVSFPAMFRFWGQVSVNSTNPNFDCSAIDAIYEATPKADREALLYTCRASVSGSSRDSAKHLALYHKPKEIPKAMIGGIVIGCVALIALRKERPPSCSSEEEASDDSEELEMPPIYREHALPEEIPPVYKETASTNEITLHEPDSSTLNSVELNSDQQLDLNASASRRSSLTLHT
ncbi:hypothetical protein BP6252_02424 [Coleophoma cylindrospora]|uniref:Receptor L-domain domain-containing protein n=1 Tax=Coleophoma cylindrospora TaxID=1849047 RepID=A0A3D8SFD2_9HELO|nr:hypothetical protein BP6252_02424 [Coleophoma cylindrospora]